MLFVAEIVELTTFPKPLRTKSTALASRDSQSTVRLSSQLYISGYAANCFSAQTANRLHAYMMVLPSPDTLSASWGTIISTSTGMMTAAASSVSSRLRIRAAFGDGPRRCRPPPGGGVKSFFSKNAIGTFSTKAVAPPMRSGETTPPTNLKNPSTWDRCCKPV